MAVRSRRVTVEDMDGITHSVEVSAEIVRAVAQGLAALRGKEWIAGLQQQGTVKVSVADVRVEHQVKLSDFTQWVEKPGGKSPREVIQRKRVRAILGMPVSGERQS